MFRFGPSDHGASSLLHAPAQVINAHGMYVILDYHGSSGSSLETDAISKADTFATRWSEVWRAVSCLPRFQQDLAGRVLADILNEPDMLNLKWVPRFKRAHARARAWARGAAGTCNRITRTGGLRAAALRLCCRKLRGCEHQRWDANANSPCRPGPWHRPNRTPTPAAWRAHHPPPGGAPSRAC